VLSINLKTNALIVFNARAFEYEVQGANRKTILLTNFVPGPQQPPEKKAYGFI